MRVWIEFNAGKHCNFANHSWNIIIINYTSINHYMKKIYISCYIVSGQFLFLHCKRWFSFLAQWSHLVNLFVHLFRCVDHLSLVPCKQTLYMSQIGLHFGQPWTFFLTQKDCNDWNPHQILYMKFLIFNFQFSPLRFVRIWGPIWMSFGFS